MKDTLCNNHDTIINNLIIIKKELQRLNCNPEIYELAFETKKLCKHCKKLGQRMENRLKKYRYAIEDLGFVRKEKNAEKKDYNKC